MGVIIEIFSLLSHTPFFIAITRSFLNLLYKLNPLYFFAKLNLWKREAMPWLVLFYLTTTTKKYMHMTANLKQFFVLKKNYLIVKGLRKNIKIIRNKLLRLSFRWLLIFSASVFSHILPRHLIPSKVTDPKNYRQLIQKVQSAHKSFAKTNLVQLQLVFLNYCWSLNVYGCTFFKAFMLMSKVKEIFVNKENQKENNRNKSKECEKSGETAFKKNVLHQKKANLWHFVLLGSCFTIEL